MCATIQSMYYVYLLETAKDKRFYVGYTNDLKRRFFEHNAGENISTRYGRPWKLIYYEAYGSKEIAQHRERVLKQRGKVYQGLKKRIVSS